MGKVDAAQLNFLATVLVSFFSLAALYRLDRRHASTGRFLFRAYCCWLLAWACWDVLWGIEAFRFGPFVDDVIRAHSLLFFSDLNTAFIMLFYLGLTRADDITPSGYVILAILLAATFVAVDVALLHFPGGVGGLLQDRWSMALSMAAPVLIGWACNLRYGSSTVLIIGLIYAIGQPAAQEAVLGQRMPQETAGVVLTLLATLKIMFGASVTLVMGYEPATYQPLVRSATRRETPARHDAWWPALPAILLGGGLLTVILMTAVRNPSVFNSVSFAQIVGVISLLAGLLKIFEFIVSRSDTNVRKSTTGQSVANV